MNRIKSRTGEYPVKKRLAVRTVLALVLVLAFPGGITGCRKKQDNEIEAIRKAGVLQVAIVETGSRFTCNFYKIKESKGLTHFASFAPITAPEPDFHLPEYFAHAQILELPPA